MRKIKEVLRLKYNCGISERGNIAELSDIQEHGGRLSQESHCRRVKLE